MQEFAAGFHHLESPPPGAALAPGWHWFRGWVIARDGANFADVRLRRGDRVFPAVHGFPRADLAAHFRTGRPHALAQFIAVVEVTAPGELVCEALDAAGIWQPFARLNPPVAPDGLPATAVPPVASAVRGYEFRRALQLLLHRCAARPRVDLALLAREVAAALPAPHELQFAPPPLVGHLDEPALVTTVTFGRAPVIGWLHHPAQPIRRVLASYDLQAWHALELGRATPHAVAPQAGFLGHADVPAQLPDPLCLRLYAELADGNLLLCQVLRGLRFDHEERKAPYPARSEVDFAAARAALAAALAERGLTVRDDAGARAELDDFARDFAQRAPSVARAPAPPRPAASATVRPIPRRVLLASHNLNLEGAPLFLLDYARALVAAGSAVTVASPVDGPLRAAFADAGARVQVVAAPPGTDEPVALARALGVADHDLVVANTFLAHWAVHAARQAGRPSLLYIHESTTPAAFLQAHVARAALPQVEAAFAAASHVSFLTEATRRYYAPLLVEPNHGILPGWIDLARIDRYRADHPRAELRRRLGLAADTKFVVNLGTVCDRKGQHIFARAVDLLARAHPALAGAARFAMVGGRHSVFDRDLAGLLAELGRANLALVPETAEPLAWLAAADLFVCSSYEESFPRVVLEAMACEVPVLSTGVHGIPDMIRPEAEGLLVPPGDSHALADGLARLLADPDLGRRWATRARARVAAEFDSRVVMPRHLALACELAAGGR